MQRCGERVALYTMRAMNSAELSVHVTNSDLVLNVVIPKLMFSSFRSGYQPRCTNMTYITEFSTAPRVPFFTKSTRCSIGRQSVRKANTEIGSPYSTDHARAMM